MNMDEITINKPMIQSEAIIVMNRMLTNDEYLDVVYLTAGDLWRHLRKKIAEVVAHNAMLERNKGAELEFPHFVVYERDAGTHEQEWTKMAVFKSSDDAWLFTRYDTFMSDLLEWQVAQISEDGAEKVVTKSKY